MPSLLPRNMLLIARANTGTDPRPRFRFRRFSCLCSSSFFSASAPSPAANWPRIGTSPSPPITRRWRPIFERSYQEKRAGYTPMSSRPSPHKTAPIFSTRRKQIPRRAARCRKLLRRHAQRYLYFAVLGRFDEYSRLEDAVDHGFLNLRLAQQEYRRRRSLRWQNRAPRHPADLGQRPDRKSRA